MVVTDVFLEYSVRGARIAVYTLLNVRDKKIRPVTAYKNRPSILKEAIKTSFR